MASEEYKSKYLQVVNNIFNRWPALKMAVEHGHGGRSGHQTAIDIKNYMYDYCLANERASAYDIQEVLEEIMDQEFNTICEDGSIEETSASLVKYLDMCKNGKFSEIELELSKLPNVQDWLNPQVKLKYVVQDDSSDSDSSDDDDDMEVDDGEETQATAKASNSRNNGPDEDGWTVVSSKRR